MSDREQGLVRMLQGVDVIDAAVNDPQHLVDVIMRLASEIEAPGVTSTEAPAAQALALCLAVAEAAGQILEAVHALAPLIVPAAVVTAARATILAGAEMDALDKHLDQIADQPDGDA